MLLPGASGLACIPLSDPDLSASRLFPHLLHLSKVPQGGKLDFLSLISMLSAWHVEGTLMKER